MGMRKRLLVDLDKCRACPECKASCSYHYHKDNRGLNHLIEYLTFSVICRQCEDAPCIASCYHNALYKLEDGRVRRSNFLCTSCKSCLLACPFGTIVYPMLDYITSGCDLCLEKNELLCVKTCPYGALSFVEVEENLDKGIYLVEDKFAVKTSKWFKDDLIFKKK